MLANLRRSSISVKTNLRLPTRSLVTRHGKRNDPDSPDISELPPAYREYADRIKNGSLMSVLFHGMSKTEAFFYLAMLGGAVTLIWYTHRLEEKDEAKRQKGEAKRKRDQ
eukprot:TRINITY_DN2025_c1_g2_i1.p1 TRINITY_DN2025_c1_g2~~TRINITY_DN2025_c1_g2_i1.p1  ORF type:complete len:110 (-),score=11.70 TRINITY_DN2025_c1_g2_i1:39-368(-)